MSSPLAFLYKWEKETPDNLFFHQPMQGLVITHTYQQAVAEIRRVASGLKALNLPPRSKIALLSKNCSHWIMADMAIWMAGHISVPIYPTLTPGAIRQILDHSESSVIIVGKLDNYQGQREGIPERVQKISVPAYGVSEGITWDELINKHEPFPGNPVLTQEELATIIYTSGTTGSPKGVMVNFRAFDYALTFAVRELFTGKAERFFSYLPLSHIAERMLVECGAIYTGSAIYFSESLEKFPVNLMEAEPTIFLAVPRIWAKFREKILEKMPQKRLSLLLSIPLIGSLVRNKIKKRLGLSKARWTLTGASPISVEMLEWYRKLGIMIHDVYGMTENLSYGFINLHKVKFGTVGQKWGNIEARISSDGEIQTKHLATMMGYYKEEQMTKAIFTDDGYLRTGDTGQFDNEGFLSITGRIKDLFKTDKGKYVAPAPIELKLQANPDIEHVCVVGMGVPQPMALVILSAAGKAKSKAAVEESLSQTLDKVNEELETYEKLEAAVVLKEEWTVENGFVTPSLKVKRNEVERVHLPTYPGWFKMNKRVVWE